MYRKNASAIVIFLVCFIALLYCAVIFILPVVFNSVKVQNKILNFIENKFDYKIKYKNLKFKFSPKLKLIIQSDYIFIDLSKRKNSQNKNKKDINLNFLKSADIKSAEIILDNQNKIKVSDLQTKNVNNNTILTFLATLSSNRLKNEIIIGSKGSLRLENNKIYANNFSIEISNNILVINGIINKPDFNIKASNFPVKELEEAFLFYMKSIKPDKNFIENFYDFKGFADIDLNIKNKEINGKITLNDFGAKFKIFNLPLYFKSADFIFDKDKVSSVADGKFTIYPMKSIFNAQDIFSTKRTVKGFVESNIESEISKYIKNSKINGSILLKIDYFIQNQTPVVEYSARIKEGSQIKYQNYSTGELNGNRKIYAKTVKKNNDLKIDNYKYILEDNNTLIVSGDGLFKRKDSLSKFNLEYVTVKTSSFVPVSIIGSLSDYINKGEFKGEIKYDKIKNLILGNFELRKTKYKNFFVENAKVLANEQNVEISANGTFENSPFNASINLVNNFKNVITINDLKLYLKQYKIIRNTKRKSQANKKIQNTIKNTTFEIKNADLKLDKLLFKNIVLENIELIGTLKDSIIEFSMPEIHFAQGSLGAAGIYDVEYNSSFIDFYAEKINSTLASCMIFGLKEQFRGLANASMHLRTYDKLADIKAQSAFYIKDGALTKLGSSEFIINKNKKPLKFKLQDIINIDIKKMEALTSDIQGYFDINNEKIENIEIYNENKFLSLYLEGVYNVKSQNTNIELWGKYNKDAQRGIRVLFIPLSWITKFIFKNENTKAKYSSKISKIPPVEGKASQEEIVNVSASGNINDYKNLKINLKAIK